MPNKVNFLGTTFDSIKFNFFVKLLSEKGGIVFTPNVDHVTRLHRDNKFRITYTKADYVVCDSQIIIFLSRLMRKPIEEKISGSDLFPAFYMYNKDDINTNIFLLGGKPGVAEKAQININNKVGRNIVVDTYSPSFDADREGQEKLEIITRIKNSGANVVAVCLGCPKQENWVVEYAPLLPQVKIFMAIGATIDFEAGTLERSPSFISKIGLEWAFRILKEPKRLWFRYLTSSGLLFKLIIIEQLNKTKTKIFDKNIKP